MLLLIEFLLVYWLRSSSMFLFDALLTPALHCICLWFPLERKLCLFCVSTLASLAPRRRAEPQLTCAEPAWSKTRVLAQGATGGGRVLLAELGWSQSLESKALAISSMSKVPRSPTSPGRTQKKLFQCSCSSAQEHCLFAAGPSQNAQTWCVTYLAEGDVNTKG